MHPVGNLRLPGTYAWGMKRKLLLLAVCLAFALAAVFSGTVAEGMRQSLHLCAATLVPSLFPLFVLSRLLGALGLPEFLSRKLGKAMQKLFGIPGAGAQALVLGLCGGYPLGATVVAELRRDGQLSRDEAERLLAFSNNSGPAFIIGAAGGVFGSAKAGALLYAAHILSAFCTGLCFRRKSSEQTDRLPVTGNTPLSAAVFTDAVTGALESCARLCAYVCFFGAVTALFGSFRFLPGLGSAFVLGIFELGGGIGALAGWQPGPLTMALAGFLLGWGGLSVHGQTLGAVAQTDIKCARHLFGRALCGLFAAGFSFLFSYRM